MDGEHWFELRELPQCSCGRPLSKRGMIRELQADRNNRPGPKIGLTASSVARIRMDCVGCRRSHDVLFLNIDRYLRVGPSAVPTDCWPIRKGETPENTMQRVLAMREAGERPAPKREATRKKQMTQADGDRTRSWIARIREQNGWKETKA